MLINFSDFPDTYDKFMAVAPDMITKPEGTVALLITALKTYVKDRDAGLEMLNYLHGPRPLSGQDRQFIRDRMMDKTYLPDSYCVGARVDNNYTPDEPLTIEVLPDPIPAESEEFTRLRLISSGADSPRIVTLRRKKSGNEWFLWDYPGIMSGIRIPVDEDPWA
jgi:hypothetical protein